MKHLLLALVALTIGVGASAQNYIEVNGYAERQVAPDKFTLSVVITERDNRGKNSLQEQEQDIKDALKRVGVDTKSNFSLVDNYTTYVNRKNNLATRKFEVVVEGAVQLNDVMVALGELNPQRLSIVKATFTKADELHSELRREAMQDAQKSAKELAEAVDQSIGSCLHIVDYSSNSGDVDFYVNDGYSYARAEACVVDVSAYAEPKPEPEPVEFSLQTISHSVRVRFVLLE